MAKETRISWTKSSFNPWIGCSKVSDGCQNCYAETMDKRAVFDGVTHWGAGVPRKRTSEQNWNAVRRWNRIAPDTEFAGRKGFWPVFCASLGDVFDNEVPVTWRMDLFKLIAETPNLTWLILTKRIGNVMQMCSGDGLMFDQLPNIWLGATVVNQEEADRDIPKLLKIPAKVRFLSIEPMLGRLDLCEHFGMWWNSTMQCFESTGVEFNRPHGQRGVDWVIVGGESGSKARPMHPNWARGVRDQCAAAGVPFFYKQNGEYRYEFPSGVPDDPLQWVSTEGVLADEPVAMLGGSWHGIIKVGTKASGCELDRTIHHEFPVGG